MYSAVFLRCKYFLVLLISLLALCTSSLPAHAAKLNTPLFYGGYSKGDNSFDIVVKYLPGKSLVLYVNGKKAGHATVQKDTWVTFHKVNLLGKGNIYLTQDDNDKASSFNYKRYYEVSASKVRFYSTAVTLAMAHVKTVAYRTKTSSCVITANREQDSACTPGAVFDVTKEMVCKRGYSKSVRNVAESTKKQVFAEYGITSHASGQYEVDHLVSLELGGSNSISNLWPEAATPVPGFHEKDKVENELHKQVCNGSISLVDAQQKIASQWVQVYVGLYPPASAPIPAPTPVHTPTPAPAPDQVQTPSGGSTYYANCSEARAAGAAPIHSGQLGYRPALDRDHDGIACE